MTQGPLNYTLFSDLPGSTAWPNHQKPFCTGTGLDGVPEEGTGVDTLAVHCPPRPTVTYTKRSPRAVRRNGG